MNGKRWGWLAGVFAVLACGNESLRDGESSIGTTHEALTQAQSRVLGFEAPTTDWRASAGTVSSSTTRSQGSFSLGIRPNGWTEITSVPLASLGNVNNTFRYQIRLPSLPVWGETRVILLAPSRGIYWAELGSRDLRSLPVGSFQNVSFSIPATLESVLDGAYSDLQIKIVVNAQTLSQPYLIDNIVLAAPDGGGGSGGGGGSAGSSGGPNGTTRQFSVLRPTGVTIENTFMSATDHLTYFGQATIGQDGKTPALASFGSATTTYMQAASRAFGNIYSVPNVQLDAKTLVGGFVRTRGTISKQGVGTADAPVVRGGEFPNQTVLPLVTSWSVEEPTTHLGDVELFATPTIQNHVIPPGSYGRFNIHDRRRVFLSSGTYFFHSFNTEPLAEILVNKTNGPVVIYVRDSFTYRGRFTHNGGPLGSLLVGYSGTSDAFLQAPFVGTIVAPNATIKLERPTSAQHRGSFYGKGIEVASGTHTVLHEPFNFDFICPRGDADADGVLDCFDVCNADPTKTDPGICGCNVPDVDTDGDKVHDCVDGCPNDPTAQYKGTCGCPSAPEAEGGACVDSPCRGGFTCSAGICGDPNACRPDPSCVLRFLEPTQQYYWICNAPVTWVEARDLCGAVDGRKLAQIDTAVENSFLANNLTTSSMWTGANDRATDGEWFWNNFVSDSGDHFWTGGSGGKSYFARFAAWNGGVPPNGSASCGRITSASHWTAQDCADTAGFVCELGTSRTDDIGEPPIDPPCEIFGVGCNPDDDPTDCVNEADAFGGLSEAQVLDAFSICQSVCTANGENSPECQAACSGPATPPASGETCPNDDQEFPPFSEVDSCGASTILPGNIPCESSADCPEEQGSVCSREYPGGGATAPRLCVVPSSTCATAPDFPERCADIELCEPEHEQTVTTVVGQGADLSEEPFNPRQTFGAPTVAPEAPYPPDDDPCGGSCVGRGQNHPWCKLGPADPTPVPQPVNPNRHGNTDGELISFEFDPKFELTHSANIGAFGLPRLNVKATAGVSAGVNVNLPGVPDFTIIDLLVALEANQCGIYRSEQTADILGQDFIALADLGEFGVPVVFPSEATQEACANAYAAFEDAANRSKKALRDAVELYQQYRAGIANDVAGQASTFTNNLKSDLCRQVAASVPRGFPTGPCPATGSTESPEATINRFIEYYRRSVLGFAEPGIRGLSQVATDLKNSVNALTASPTFQIFTYGDAQEDTLASAQFFIGPIPVFLDVESAVQYGVDLKGRAQFNAGPIVDAILRSDGPTPAQKIAFVGVEGAPFAGASLGLFAGVGFGVPGFKVKLGMAADLTLGSVQLPAYAGAGIGLGAEVDGRGPPSDLEPLSTGVNLIPAKRFVTDLQFTAGLGLKVRNVLNGEISGKLKISVLFFSKSWKKRIFKFTGICAGSFEQEMADCDFDLITFNGSTDAASGAFEWAEIRMPTPFPQLKPILVNAPTGQQNVDFNTVEEFFFDGLCDCIDGTNTEETRVCVRDADCCDNTPNCFTDPADGQNKCIECRHREETCVNDEDCCGGLAPDGSRLSLCNQGVCKGQLDCSLAGTCTRDDECVTNQQCTNTGRCFRSECTPR